MSQQPSSSEYLEQIDLTKLLSCKNDEDFSGRITVTKLQRKLGFGYNRSTRLFDKAVTEGIVILDQGNEVTGCTHRAGYFDDTSLGKAPYYVRWHGYTKNKSDAHLTLGEAICDARKCIELDTSDAVEHKEWTSPDIVQETCIEDAEGKTIIVARLLQDHDETFTLYLVSDLGDQGIPKSLNHVSHD